MARARGCGHRRNRRRRRIDQSGNRREIISEKGQAFACPTASEGNIVVLCSAGGREAGRRWNAGAAAGGRRLPHPCFLHLRRHHASRGAGDSRRRRAACCVFGRFACLPSYRAGDGLRCKQGALSWRIRWPLRLAPPERDVHESRFLALFRSFGSRNEAIDRETEIDDRGALGVYLISGSRVTFPMRMTLLTLAMIRGADD